VNGPSQARTLGFDMMSCQIDDINGDYANVVDQFGQEKQVLVNLQRAKGVRPKVGERWIIDRSFGYWTLAACLTPADRAPEKFVAISPIAPSAWNVVHGIGTKDVQVSVRETASGLITAFTVHVEDENTVQVTLAATHPAGYYTAVVIG
jgi:hypothetical protein